RVAARAVNSDLAGSVFYDLEVPEFGKQNLGFSGLVLTSATAGMVPTAGSVPMFKDVLPNPPTATRVFFPFDTLALFAEIYDGESNAHTLDVATTLTASDGAVAFRTVDQRQTGGRTAAGARGPALVYTAQVPLKTMPPGIYSLKVEATSRMGKKPPHAERALLVKVLPAPPPAPGAAPAAAAPPPPAPGAPAPPTAPAPSPSPQ
ncbi:MAG TPA: hypothetical protein VGQ33_20880, partial [Vicinamibacteria bacterium]|nr:hypothetical protein [Vicinamibacteria bacterium]